ncbi:MAG: GntR family transcriptional regulator [Paracoccaceae bacterium]
MALESFNNEQKFTTVRGGKRSNQISENLRRQIILGLLVPNESLLELELAQHFRVSQSTIREALLVLQEEGLVIRIAHRGTHVAECQIEDMVELLHLRHDIETRGIVRGIERYDRLTHRALTDLVSQMIDAAKDDDEYALSQLDCQFHMRIYEEAGLPSVQPVLRRCLVHNHRYKIQKSERSRSLLFTAERHIPILEALDSGDLSKAVAALSQHINTIVDLGPNILNPSEITDAL